MHHISKLFHKVFRGGSGSNMLKIGKYEVILE